MKHKKINIVKLVKRMKKAAGTTDVTALAKSSKIHPSRVSRFLNGDFKKLTPVLVQFCEALRVSWTDLTEPPPSANLSPELIASLNRIIGRDPSRIRSTTQLLRSLEALISGSDKPIKYRSE